MIPHRANRTFKSYRFVVINIGELHVYEAGETYHGKHHQRIIPAEGLDDLESDETSQANRNEREAQEDSRDDEDG